MTERPFWQWFAEEGYHQVIPALMVNTNLESSPLEEKLAGFMVEALNVPEDQLYAPNHRPNEDEFMRKGRLILSEFADIDFEFRPLKNFRGELIAWKGSRTFCLSIEATPDQETDTILHMMAHIVLKHIDEKHLTVRIEGGEGEFEQDPEEEQEANTWAQELRYNHRVLRKGII